MNSPEKDFTHRSWLATAALIAVLAAVSFIPPQSIGSVKLRRANILSDVLVFDDAAAAEPAAEPVLFDEEDFHIDLEAVAERIEADTAPRETQATYRWIIPRDSLRGPRPEPDPARLTATPVPIEDYSDSGRIRAFCDTLLNARRPSPSSATRSSRATSSPRTCANNSRRPSGSGPAAARDSPRWPRR